MGRRWGVGGGLGLWVSVGFEWISDDFGVGVRSYIEYCFLGFAVPDLETAMKKLKDDFPDPIDFIEQNVVVPSIYPQPLDETSKGYHTYTGLS